MKTSKTSPLNELGSLCDQVIGTSDSKEISLLCDQILLRLNNVHSSEHLSRCHYYLGNLFSSLSQINGETASGWRNDNFPEVRSKSINHFRECLKTAEGQHSAWNDAAKVNLGNELSYQRRGFEALAHWKPDFSARSDAPFISSLSRIRELMWLSHWLNDLSHQQLFLFEAFKQAEELRSFQGETDHPTVHSYLNEDTAVKKLLDQGAKNFGGLENWQKDCEMPSDDDESKAYRLWCLDRGLFANPMNYITSGWIADQDILQFPNHVVKVGDGPFFQAAFSSMKREYCFARFLAYEGFQGIHPGYENERLFLTDTLDYVLLDGTTEKIKTSIRLCFGVFDSLASLMNRYFEIGDDRCKFASKWIKEKMAEIDNPFIDALYWLACDLTDTTTIPPKKWKAPNAELSEIRKLRSSMEHGWLRISESPETIWNKESDFAETITPSDLRRVALLTLKTTNAALHYLAFAVTFHERNKEKNGFTPSIVSPIIKEVSRS